MSTDALTIKLAKDSIWLPSDESPDYVTIKSIKIGIEDLSSTYDDGTVSTVYNVYVYHDAPWQIYTDTGFAKGLTKLVQEVALSNIPADAKFGWSEQGLQDVGVAHLEYGVTVPPKKGVVSHA